LKPLLSISTCAATSWAEYYASRQRLAEAVNINTGLLALKKCIDALHEVGRCRLTPI